jgi:cyclohexyl-isocyanide hydratase
MNLGREATESPRITSVCTGALILGAAGLLEGYRATTHWMALDALPGFGAEPVKQFFSAS